MRGGLRQALLLSLLASAAGAQNLPPGTQPMRGTLRVHSAVAADSQRKWVPKIFPLLEDGLFKVADLHLDYVGLSEEGFLFSTDAWLAYRGAVGSFAQARPQLTGIPGFTWKREYREVSVFGSDHRITVGTVLPIWPALRLGRLAADFPVEYLNQRALINWMRRPLVLDKPSALYQEALATDLFNTGLAGSAALPPDLLVLEPPRFPLGGSTAPSGLPTGYNLPNGSQEPWSPVESIWGRPSADLAGSLGLNSAQTAAQDRQNFGLIRMGNLADQLPIMPAPATDILPRLQDAMLRKGDPPDSERTRLPLVPGFSTLSLEANLYNRQYQEIYGQYYCLLQTGVGLFQSYGSGASNFGTVSVTSLEQARLAWLDGTARQKVDGAIAAPAGEWDPDFLKWLQEYDPDQPLVASLDAPSLGIPERWAVDLDPQRLRKRPRLRERMALIELGFGQRVSEADPDAPKLPPQASPSANEGGYAPISSNKHFYNLALRNGWRVAPSTGLDNMGALSAHNRMTVPRGRSCFTGLYLGSEAGPILQNARMQLPRQAGERMAYLLEQGFRRRQTFVSEHPFIDAQFSARDLSTGKDVVMGGSLFEGRSGAGVTTFEFRLKLDVPTRNQYTDNLRIPMPDLKMVEIGERERPLGLPAEPLRIVDVARRDKRLEQGAFSFSKLFADEIPIVPYYTRGAVAQPGAAGGIPTVLATYGIGAHHLDVGDPPLYPLPLTLTWRVTSRPHTSGQTMAYYMLVKLPTIDGENADLITAPLWTVADWARFEAWDDQF